MPCCLAIVLALIFPRIILVVTWFLNPAFISNAYGNWVIPLLGLIFMPMTALAYALAVTFESGATGVPGLIIIILAVLYDLGSVGGGAGSGAGS
ncbi:MAG: hypothetical protein GY894_09920 [Planctomycetes bacterium]|nr:hypothetical protein [Planctomycetota bacterium]MCP4839657.1 hypothetical protein [Planctomycetota bacterium]